MRYDPNVISENIKRTKKIKKFLKVIFYIIFIPIILFSLFLIASELGNSDEVPSFFNISLYKVASSSMEPKLKVGDIIVVKSGYDINSFKEGNIITFYDSKGEIITHRIKEIKNTYDSKVFVTKGDANDIEDSTPIKYESILGRVVYTIPSQFSFMVNILQNRIVFILLVIILILIILYDGRVKERQIQRKIEREEKKKKSEFYF